MIIKYMKYLAAAALCICILANMALAGSLSYNNQRKVIKAGVLSFSPGVMPSYPYVFYVMDQRLDIKPSGWEFVNPLALSSQKSTAAYWEVSSQVPFEDIAQFDVLFLAAPAGTTINFTREEKEKLRKFVDGGGVLWIENGGAAYNGNINFAGFFIPNIDFGPTAVRPCAPKSPAHPLVARPFNLSWQEINNIGSSGNSGTTVSGTTGLPDIKYFTSIIVDKNNKPLVSGAQYGSGHIVITGEPVSQAIARTVGEAAPGISNKNNLVAAQSEDLKLAYNIVNWGSEYTTFHKDPRHTGYSFAEVGAPLTALWEFKTPTPAATFTSPVIIDDMVFYVDGDGILHAFDLSPSRDRDMDGNPDDGIVDQSNGTSYDELWRYQVGVGSSITAAYVPLGGTAVPGIGVVTLDGKVYGFDASNMNPSPLSLFTTNALSGFSAYTAIAPPLTYSDGGLYIGDGLGSLHGISFFNGLQDWVAPKAPIASLGPTVAAPTAGYVYDRVSAAMDQVVYLPRQGMGGATPMTGGIQVFPMKIYNEILTSDASGNGYTPLVSRRTIGCRIKDGKWKLYVPTDSGNIDITSHARLAVQPGTFEVDMDALSSLGLLGNPILADYETDPAGDTFNPRSMIMIKANPNEPVGVSCTPALSADDVLFFSADNGSLYAVQESSDPDPRKGYSLRTEVRWRSYLGDPELANLLGSAGTVPIAVGSPCVGNDMAYFAVNVPNGGSYILAFKSNPVFEINLGIPLERDSTIEFVQDDSMNIGTEPTRVIYRPADANVKDWIDVNYATGKITMRNFRATGSPRQDLSATRELSVGYIKSRFAGGDGSTRETKTVYAFPQVNSAGKYYKPNPTDKWNNLAWCIKLPAAITSSPMVFGSKLYVGMNNGNLAAIDVNKAKDAASKLDINAVDPVTNVPEENLGVLLKWDTNSGYMWDFPAMQGNNSPVLATTAGSNGMLAVSTANGLSVMYNPITLVADGNRIVEIDAAGEVVWSCDATTNIAETTTGTANDMVFNASSVPFNRPAVARRSDIGGIVVADTGNNRVVLVDSGGKVLWQITDFTDPKTILPAGSPLKLSRPMDVTAWMQWDNATGIPQYHFLITDSGNFRVIDVVAKWDDATGAYNNELNWVTRSILEGNAYQYTSARLMPDSTNWNNWVVMAIVSGQQVTNSGPDGAGGALVKINYSPATESAGPMIGDPYTSLPIDVSNPATTVSLLNPRYFSRVYKTNTEFTDVIIDANALYVVSYGANNVIRKYTADDYLIDSKAVYGGAGKPFYPSYAQILPNGNILVTNKAISEYNAGEVFELKWDPALKAGQGGYVIEWPGKDTKIGSNSFGLRQPSSAERQVY